MTSGRVLCLAALLVSTMCASDPVKLHTKIVDNRAISFQLDNKYHAPVTRFEVAAASATGNLGCTITAEVKRPTDLHPPGTCSFTTNGKLDKNWTAHIVYVEFADGTRWTSLDK